MLLSAARGTLGWSLCIKVQLSSYSINVSVLMGRFCKALLEMVSNFPFSFWLA